MEAAAALSSAGQADTSSADTQEEVRSSKAASLPHERMRGLFSMHMKYFWQLASDLEKRFYLQKKNNQIPTEVGGFRFM